MTISSTAIHCSDLKRRIEGRQARIGVIGLGYVGLPLGLLYIEERFPVTGFDIDEKKVETLNSGGTYIYRIPPTEIQAGGLKGFSATADFSKLHDMDVIVICVPTPLDEYREPDLSAIKTTAAAIAPHLRAGQLVVLESTTYPGTTEEVLVPILEGGNRAGCGRRAANQPMGTISSSLPSRLSEKIREMTALRAGISQRS